MDAALTSSTSLISFKLNEVSKFLTSGRDKAYWFMLEPVLMSKQVFDGLSKDEQKAIMAVGAEMEQFATTEAQKDDKEVAEVFKKSGAKVFDIDEKTVKIWQQIARDTAWKDYANNPNCKSCAKLLDLAQKTLN
jgi:TRAP-type C4-dicarboxylate transport system substrate-binding protein